MNKSFIVFLILFTMGGFLIDDLRTVLGITVIAIAMCLAWEDCK